MEEVEELQARIFELEAQLTLSQMENDKRLRKLMLKAESPGWHWHRYTQWTSPDRQAVQRRVCIKCAKAKARRVNVKFG